MPQKKKRKKRKQPETPMERFKAIPLWTWGLVIIMAGVFANLTNQMMIESQNLSGAAARGARFGGAIASLLFFVVGVAIIILHFVKKRRS